MAKDSNDYLIKENNILVTMTGTRGKRDYFFTYHVNDEDLKSKRLYLNQRVGILRTFPPINSELVFPIS